ncbi:MAG: hypothetical protein IJA38_03715 [Bacteroidales bacterium]|nr:hypothetical protein [Bacteroidales bacterium]MBP3343349.1 hypothetical protein [Bacteroidales bacterium]MBQ3521923.1 hypothetical protein [Bacteroidales bacterium]MBQ6871641.1 hypothetical protein [Bacteroidales bacterium]MBQ7998107.1 hypothetical protein [Bacteroidales bacterium]
MKCVHIFLFLFLLFISSCDKENVPVLPETEMVQFIELNNDQWMLNLEENQAIKLFGNSAYQKVISQIKQFNDEIIKLRKDSVKIELIHNNKSVIFCKGVKIEEREYPFDDIKTKSPTILFKLSGIGDAYFTTPKDITTVYCNVYIQATFGWNFLVTDMKWGEQWAVYGFGPGNRNQSFDYKLTNSINPLNWHFQCIGTNTDIAVVTYTFSY